MSPRRPFPTRPATTAPPASPPVSPPAAPDGERIGDQVLRVAGVVACVEASHGFEK